MLRSQSKSEELFITKNEEYTQLQIVAAYPLSRDSTGNPLAPRKKMMSDNKIKLNS